MIVSNKHKEDLIKIAKKLEKKSQSFPKDENGEPTETYLEYLSLMYDPEVAELVIPLPVFPETISIVRLAKLTRLDKNTITKKLEIPAKRGFIIKLGRSYAQLMPLFVYDIPFILKINYDDHKDETKKAAYLSRKFFTEEGYYKIWQNSKKGVPRFRVLTVSEQVKPSREIIPIEEVYSIIDKWDDFAIIPCPCRNRAEIEGIRECKGKYPIHNCILFGPNAKAVLEMGDPIIKSASKNEIIEITKTAAELGLVHCTDNRAENCTILCACCECCCGMLRGLTKLDNPRAIAKANFISYIVIENCLACGTCVERCKFGAITINKYADVDSEQCVGCGLCAVTCSNNAIIMKRFEREEIPGAIIKN
ncbi:MAG: 4Fe-4S binding protein [Promethearchaeota archaeon]